MLKLKGFIYEVFAEVGDWTVSDYVESDRALNKHQLKQQAIHLFDEGAKLVGFKQKKY